MDKQFGNWDGIYTEFFELQDTSSPFVERIRHNKLINELHDSLRELQSSSRIKNISSTKDNPLPIVISLLASKNETVSVLDIGGSLANNYLKTIASMADHSNINYYIVDSRETCRIGRAELEEFVKLAYHETIPTKQKFDIVHANSSIQAKSNWQHALVEIVKLEPTYLVFTEILISSRDYNNLDSSIEDKLIPWNLDYILTIMRQLGFKEIYKSLCQTSPNDEIENNSKMRYQQRCNLILQRDRTTHWGSSED